MAHGATALRWEFLASKVALPLAFSPLLSVAVLFVAFPGLRRTFGRVDRYCVCLEKRIAVEPAPFVGAATTTGRVLGPAGFLALDAATGSRAESAAAPIVAIAALPIVARTEECAASPIVAGRLSVSDTLHWASAAMTSFARGLNDTPKIVALGLVASAAIGVPAVPFYALIAAAIGAGSLVAGFRVTETLARKVTPMTPAEGVSANLVTTLLVGLASWMALPVSTTHVSSGAIIGLGLHRGARTVHWRIVGGMLLGWLVTLPIAALVGAGAYAILR